MVYSQTQERRRVQSTGAGVSKCGSGSLWKFSIDCFNFLSEKGSKVTAERGNTCLGYWGLDGREDRKQWSRLATVPALGNEGRIACQPEGAHPPKVMVMNLNRDLPVSGHDQLNRCSLE
jgi:hypothetical protein